MRKTDKIKFIGEKLDELFPNPPIPLAQNQHSYGFLIKACPELL